jgi:hypothetical protein
VIDQHDPLADALHGGGDGVTATLAGSLSSSPASLPISVGMVAEKNRFWRSLGRCFTIWRIGRTKPRSSIWSASSRTKISTP